ncbi:MAG: family 10 glycosylhydrolase [Fimbriimonadales bacterium]|nr:family 10 glycosylhydrolase [Fimbriimonadales bacterium]
MRRTDSAGMRLSARHRLPDEARALWVVRTSMVSPESVERVAQLATRYGFNALFVQVRGRGDAYYRSSYEPRAEALASQPDDFDPLAYLLQCVAGSGVQVHAWLNVFYVWSTPRMPRSRLHVVSRRPNWIARDAQNRYQMTTAGKVEGVYLCPSNPNVRAHLLKVFGEVAQRYPQLDGLHLDYVRYPYEGYCYCAGCRARFRAAMLERASPSQRAELDRRATGRNPLAWIHAFPTEWSDWRREQVSAFVRAFCLQSRRINPNLILSAAVWPVPELAAKHKLQNWLHWLRSDWLDVVLPMAYDKDTAVVERQAARVVSVAQGRPVIVGVGAWQIHPDSAVNKIRAIRRQGARGFCLFSYDAITQHGKTETYLRQIEREVNPNPFGES